MRAKQGGSVSKPEPALSRAAADSAMREVFSESVVHQAARLIAEVSQSGGRGEGEQVERQVRAAQSILDRTVGRPRIAAVRMTGTGTFGPHAIKNAEDAAAAINATYDALREGLIDGDQANAALGVIDRALKLFGLIEDTHKADTLETLLQLHIPKEGGVDVQELQRASLARKQKYADIEERLEGVQNKAAEAVREAKKTKPKS